MEQCSTRSRSSKASRSGGARVAPIRFVDLFCGIGALRLAFEQQDARCVRAYASDPESFECYRENFTDDDGSATHSDIPSHDILLADLGACAVGRTRSDQHGAGTILDILTLKRPAAILISNAAQPSLGEDTGETPSLVRDLTALGYFVHRETLDARRFGLPQARPVNFIVGFDHKVRFSFPNGGRPVTDIAKLLETRIHERYYLAEKERDRVIARQVRMATDDKDSRIGFVNGCANALSDAPDAPYRNIIIDRQRRWRRLTEREAARLQGFPDSFVLHPDRRAAFKQLARCVPVPCAAAVAERIIAAVRPGRVTQKVYACVKSMGDDSNGRKSRGSRATEASDTATVSASPLRWYGSLNGYAKKIVAMFPKHESYCEVFGGSAAILLSKPPSKIETYNDIDQNLVAFFRAVREPRLRRRLIEMVEMTPFGRDVFRDCLSDQGDADDPVKKAWSFVVICNQARNGRGVNESDWAYNKSRDGNNPNAWAKLPQRLAEVGQRLKRVQVENLAFEDCLRRYDSRDTLFVCDPPYLPETRASGTRYNHECSRDDHIRLLRIARNRKAKVVICGYRNELYDDMLNDWQRTDFKGPSFAGPRTKGRKLPKRVLSVWTSYEPPSR